MLWRAEWALAVLIFVLPLEKISYYVGFTLKPYMLLLPIVSIRYWLNVACFRRHWRWMVLMAFLLGVFMSIGLLTSTAITDPLAAARRLIQYMLLSALLLASILLVKSRQRAQFAVKCLIWTGMLVALYGIFQIVGRFVGFETEMPLVKYLSYRPELEAQLRTWTVALGELVVPRASSTFNDPSLMAGFLIGVLPFPLIGCLTAAARRQNGKFIAGMLCSGVLLVGIALSFSRSGWVGALFAVAATGYFWRRVLIRMVRSREIRVFGLIGLFGLLPVAGFAELAWQRVAQTFTIQDISTAGHLTYAMAALKMFAEHPFSGIGIGNYSSYYATHIAGQASIYMSHSAPLTLLAETGLIGTVIALIMGRAVFRLFRTALKQIRPESSDYALLTGCISGLIGILGGNLGYDYHNQAYIWFIAGLSISVCMLILSDVRLYTQKVREPTAK